MKFYTASKISRAYVELADIVESGGGGGIIDGYQQFIDEITGLNYRTGVRNGQLVTDKELTEVGFDGAESVDDGVTGDWINVKTIE